MSKDKVIVNSWNEWDPLKHVIVGKADGCCIPAPEPIDESIPKIKPTIEFDPVLPNAIIIIPIVAIKIDIKTFNEILSLRNKKARSAVKKGIAAKQSKVIAADVLVIE